jgi:acyl-CoA dehydrogenase
MASEIATELAEQADRALTDAADVAVLRSLEAGAWPASTWDAMAALGLNGALVAEDAGGVGLGFADVAPLLEVLGRHAAPVPLAESIFGSA